MFLHIVKLTNDYSWKEWFCWEI